jgi:hypothetical protein
MLFLGTVTCAQQQGKQQQQGKPDQQRQQQRPAVQGAAWQVELGGGCSSAGAYETLDMVVAAAEDGSLQAGIATWLASLASTATPAETAAAAAPTAIPCQESYVICSWGSEVELAARLLHPYSSKGAQQLRLVLTRGSTVIFDREQALQQPCADSNAWQVKLQLPSSCGDSTRSNKAGSGSGWVSAAHDSTGSSPSMCSMQQHDLAVLSLYMLPADAAARDATPARRSSGSSSTSNTSGSAAKALSAAKATAAARPHVPANQEPFAPLAHVSLLMLPSAAAQELTEWLHHHGLTQQQLRPVLADLAVAVEAWSMACGNDAASLDNTACESCDCQAGSRCGCGGCGVSVEHWELAVAAAERLVWFSAARGFCSCSGLPRQLLAALHRVQPQQAAVADTHGCSVPV